MMSYILFDQPILRQALLPITYTRPIAQIRMGIWSIAEKWSQQLGKPVSYLTEGYLSAKYAPAYAQEQWYLNGAVCPNAALVAAIETLPPETALWQANTLLALRTNQVLDWGFDAQNFARTDWPEPILQITQLTDIFSKNGEAIRQDFNFLTQTRQTEPLNDRFTAVYGSDIFIEKGAKIRAASLNAEGGPIYIGADVEVQEGSHIVGPVAICEGSVLNLGAKIRPNTTIGPFCKMGGEISNAVVFGYSNKGHEGFMGNAVIGEWCNWGASTNNSNLKNDYGKVDLYSYASQRFESTGLQFCGIVMADHSKSAIGTLFNTGTVVGVSCNVFHFGLSPRHIASYTWGGGAAGSRQYLFRKAVQVARQTMERRGKPLDATEEGILRAIYDMTEAQHGQTAG